MRIKSIIGITLFSLLVCISCMGQSEEKEIHDFSYQDQPIHPKLVMEFVPWASDDKPITISVDVAAAYNSNEYFADLIYDKGGNIGFQDENDNFSYKWLGVLDNGVHVVQTSNVMVGVSGVFKELLFIKLHTQEFDLNGEIYEQMIMTLVKSYLLGDRTNPEISVLSDKVIINKPLDHDKEVVVQF